MQNNILKNNLSTIKSKESSEIVDDLKISEKIVDEEIVDKALTLKERIQLLEEANIIILRQLKRLAKKVSYR